MESVTQLPLSYPENSWSWCLRAPTSLLPVLFGIVICKVILTTRVRNFVEDTLFQQEEDKCLFFKTSNLFIYTVVNF